MKGGHVKRLKLAASTTDRKFCSAHLMSVDSIALSAHSPPMRIPRVDREGRQPPESTALLSQLYIAFEIAGNCALFWKHIRTSEEIKFATN